MREQWVDQGAIRRNGLQLVSPSHVQWSPKASVRIIHLLLSDVHHYLTYRLVNFKEIKQRSKIRGKLLCSILIRGFWLVRLAIPEHIRCDNAISLLNQSWDCVPPAIPDEDWPLRRSRGMILEVMLQPTKCLEIRELGREWLSSTRHILQGIGRQSDTCDLWREAGYGDWSFLAW